MKKKHFIWLFFGVLFWGCIVAFWIFFLQEGSLLKYLFIYIFSTAVLTLIVQFNIGGFIIISPKNFFFIPLICWIIVIIWGSIQTGGFEIWDSFW